MPVFRCPTCGVTHRAERLEEVPNRPFCSRRCQLIDLGEWLGERYVVSRPLQEEDLDRLGPLEEGGTSSP